MRDFSLNIRGKLHVYDRPLVMGIINATPDSLYSSSRHLSIDSIKRAAVDMIDEGADIIDLGAYSTRPGHSDVSVDEELSRLELALAAVRDVAPHIPISVDTFREQVAREAITQWGADIINDVSGACDNDMLDTAAALGVPYILTHNCHNQAVCTISDKSQFLAKIIADLAHIVSDINLRGINDVIIDPGFGFGKSLQQNYWLLESLRLLDVFDLPILVGVSRKSMATKLLGISADKALNATTVLNTLALDRGASILRVHDVKAAREAVSIFCHTLIS